jgi:hypothetical protein
MQIKSFLKYVFFLSALFLVVTVIFNQLTPTNADLSQVDALVKKCQPHLVGEDEKIFGGKEFFNLKIEIFGVIDTDRQELMLDILREGKNSERIKRKVIVVFYPTWKVEEIQEANGWIKKVVKKEKILRKVNLP